MDFTSIKTWIFTITRNKVIDYWRKNKNQFTQNILDELDSDGHEKFQINSFCDSPQEIMEGNEITTEIKKAISDLSPIYRDIANLFLNQEYSYDDIAEHLDIPLGTVKAKINRLKALLQSKLNKYSYMFNTTNELA